MDKNDDAKRNDNGEANGVIKFGLCVKEEFKEETCVDMICGIEHTVLVSAIMLSTATTLFLHKLQQFIVPRVSLKATRVVKDKRLAFKDLVLEGTTGQDSVVI